MRLLRPSTGVFFCAVLVFAQGDRGTITGTVTDPAGAVIANAAVQARNVETGAQFTAASTDTGNYTLPELPAGSYEMTVNVPGFKRYVRSGLTIQVAQVARIDVALEVGASTESVTVQADAALLKTESGDLSHNISVESLDTLPILGIGTANAGSSGIRNPNAVTQLIPGAYYAANSNIVINGAPTNTESYRVEGMDATNQLISFATQETQPGSDAIQEVSIQTSNYAPEYGTVGGGFYNVTMKSGTNQFHGSGYDYFVNEVLNAGQPFTNDGNGNLVRPRQRRNDYGMTFGGPVWIPKVYNGHDKTFFFFTWEQFREGQTISPQIDTVPTDAMRIGDFSRILAAGRGVIAGAKDNLGRTISENMIYDPATEQVAPNGGLVRDPFPNNVIPQARFDTVATNIQNLIPKATLNTLVGNVNLPWHGDRATQIPSLKVDQLVGSKQKFSFYWSTTGTDSLYAIPLGGMEGFPPTITVDRGTFIHSKIFRLNYDYTVSPTVLLHAGAGYQQNNFFDDAPDINFDPATIGLKGGTLKRNFPVITGLVSTVYGGMQNMGPVAGQIHQYLEKPTFNTSATWVKSNHTYKFGGELRLEGYPRTPYSNLSGTFAFSGLGINSATALPQAGLNLLGASIGFGYANFLLGDVGQVVIGTPAVTRVGKQQWGLFAQDSWKVTRKFTLDYGLRWDYGTYPREQYGRASDFSPAAANPTVGGLTGGTIFEATCGCAFAQNYKLAFGPRLGAAYQITSKTVLRVGWGLVYSPTATLGATVANSVTYANSGINESAFQLQNGIPVTPVWPVYSAGLYPNIPANTSSFPGYIDRNAGRPARQNQWSIGLQQELSRNLVIEASYVANRGAWWPDGALSVPNLPSPATFAAHNLDPYNNAADRALLALPISNPKVVAHGFTAPYAGFPAGATLLSALRPFPQFNDNLNPANAPLGDTWYDSLQAKLTKRFSHGLQLTSVFTWSKSLTNIYTTAPTDVFNRALLKSYSAFDQPFSLNSSVTYTVPKVNTNRELSWVARDWELGAFLGYASGLPILAPTATNILNVGESTRFNRVAGQPLYLKDLNCHCINPATDLVLNPAAWQNPADGSFSSGAPYYSDFRYQRRPNESFNLGRNFRVKERYNLQIRMEFTNIFNRTELNSPGSIFTGIGNPLATTTHNASGALTGGWGFINSALTGTTAAPPRQGTLVARFTF